MNMLGSLRTFLATLVRMTQGELRGLRNLFLRLAGALYFLFIFQLATDSYVASSVVGVIIWTLSISIIFNIRRITNMAIVGEAFEALHVTPVTPAEQSAEGAASALINPLNELFWHVSLQLFFFITIAALAVPLLPLRNNPSFVFFLPLFIVASAIAFRGTVLVIANFLSCVLLVGLIVFHIAALFPQIGYYTGLNKLTGKILTYRAADLSNQADRLRARQRAEMIETAQQGILDWQGRNPGKDLPAGDDLLLAVDAAKQGLSLREFKDNLKAETNAKKEVEEKAKRSQLEAAKEALRLQKEMEKRRKTPTEAHIEENGFDWKVLPAGEYSIEPKKTKVKENSGERSRDSNGMLSLARETKVYFSFPGTEAGKIIITPKN